MSRIIKTAVLLASFLRSVSAQNGTGVTCPSTAPFKAITAQEYFTAINPGWNLGNTLDAIETEGSWNNPPVVGSTFDDAKKAGFKGIRIPITWAYHFTSQSPEWKVDEKWLQRVSDVVDMVLERDLYALVNVHHDSTTWAILTDGSTNVTMVEEKIGKLWYQIGAKLACKGEKVAFETINEIPASTAEHGAVVNRINNIFLQAINDAGGHNAQRVVTLVGAGEDGLKTTQWFEPPDSKFKNPWGIQYHYYSPYDFVFQAWGKTIWGSDADKAALDADLALVRGNFTDIPLIIGEWSVSPTFTETAARWRYFDHFVRTAAKYNTSTILWDNGLDYLERASHQWRDTVVMDIYRNAAQGIPNALPDSTTDPAATKQDSSAYIYHELNSTVADVTLPFHFNGNTLESIQLAGNKTLASGEDYTVKGESITFSSALLSTILSPSAGTGSLVNMTLAFNRGASLMVNVVQWSTPVLSSTSSKLAATSADLVLPVKWSGLNRPAAVKATKSDGVFLVDDWTQYLGPLQQGRATYGGQWDFDSRGVIIKAALLDAVRTAGQTTKFLIDFYPRVPGNSAEYTVTV